MENNQELSKLTETPTQVANFFSDGKAFEHVQRVALMFSKSDLVPKRYQGNPGNCIIALEMAQRMKASPLLIMQHLNVIQGTPSWSSTFLIASINACGKFSPLRYEEDKEEGGRCRAWAIDLTSDNKEKVYGIWVSMNMAKAEGWSTKSGSKWVNMPALMLRYRAAAFFQRQFAPEVGMGLLTSDEIIDITPVQVVTVSQEEKEKERIIYLINDCTTVEDLERLKPSIPQELMSHYLERMDAINGKLNL